MRNPDKIKFYRNIFTVCFIPECNNFISNIHHIIPLSECGEDKFNNFIGLCNGHHRKSKIHKNWEEKQTELFTYKFYKESEILGFSSDISEIEFKTKIKHLRKELGLEMSESIEGLNVHTSGKLSSQNVSEGKLEDVCDIKRPFRIVKAKIPEIRYIDCKQCGKEMAVRTVAKKFCSEKCRRIWNLKNPGGKREERHCKYCNKSFFVNSSSKRKCCSIICLNKNVLIEEIKVLTENGTIREVENGVLIPIRLYEKLKEAQLLV